MSSFFKKVFGEPDNRKKTTSKNGKTEAAQKTIGAIQNLTIKEEQLEKKRENLEKKVAAEILKAKEFQKDKKTSQALMCIKRKKLYEEQVIIQHFSIKF